jgi:hypothetical protein
VRTDPDRGSPAPPRGGGFTRCPKCGHLPLPEDQRLPAACPACGVILAKVARQDADAAGAAARTIARPTIVDDEEPRAGKDSWGELLFAPPARHDAPALWFRSALLVAFAVWGIVLVFLDYRTGAFGSSFIHRPLLVFHEAGHVVFRLGGPWLMVLGGTLGQLLMPAVMAGALLWKNRDPFGAALGLWLVGVSLLDIAPYVYDALDPQLMLLSGRTGEDGGHDWIYLLRSVGLLQRAHGLGAAFHAAGTLVVLAALAWAALVLKTQWRRRSGGAPAAPRRRGPP